MLPSLRPNEARVAPSPLSLVATLNPRRRNARELARRVAEGAATPTRPSNRAILLSFSEGNTMMTLPLQKNKLREERASKNDRF